MIKMKTPPNRVHGVALAMLASLTLLAPVAARAEVDAEQTKSAGLEKHAKEHSESRLTRLHDRLEITAAQEALWSKVAETMRSNAETFRSNLSKAMIEQGERTAIDDLKSFLVISDEHSEGLKRLIPVFAPLYDSMTAAQKKRADHIFERDEGRDHI